jgi:hypothetical protein
MDFAVDVYLSETPSSPVTRYIPPPPYTVYVYVLYMYLFTQGRGRGER